MATKTVKKQEKTTPATEELKNEESVTEDTPADTECATEPETEKKTEPEKEGKEKVLLAQTFILYHAHQYKPGDELPGNDPAMLEAWLKAGTAAWAEVSESAPGIAVPASATAGLYGTAVSSDSDNGENLVGRVPINAGRSRK